MLGIVFVHMALSCVMNSAVQLPVLPDERSDNIEVIFCFWLSHKQLNNKWRSMVLNRIALFFTMLMLVAAQSVSAQAPDFIDLAAETTPAVVNIETTSYGQRSSRRGESDGEQRGNPHDELPEFFRRFFGPEGEGGGPRSRPDRRGGGSGFIIAEDGYIVTNHHVIDEADRIIVRLADRREFEAELIGSDEGSDIALLKVEADGLPTLKFGNSTKLRQGEWVIAIGSPFNYEQTVTAGIVSAKGRTNGAQQYVPFIQTDVAINRGNSGGPLVNMKGEVVGVNSWILSSNGGYIGLSFSIPSEVAQSTLEQLRTQGYVSRGLLGVGIEDLGLEEAEALGLDRPRGALVNRIEPDSAADNAGVKVGDVILEFNGQRIERFSDLPPLVGATRPGTEAELLIHRWGKEQTLTAVIDELPGAETEGSERGRRAGVARNQLGISVESIDAGTRERLGDPEGGVLVTGVQSDAAYRAGLRRGDVILMINNREVDSSREFNRVVEDIETGKTVALLVFRNGTTTFLAYTPERED